MWFKAFLLILSINLLTADIGRAAEIARYPLDSHVHFNYPDSPQSGTANFLKMNRFQRAILISPTYGIWRSRQTDPEFQWVRNEKLIPLINKQVSDATVANAGRFIGACGLTLHWENPVQKLVPCLNLPNMKGIKIHSEDSNMSIDSVKNFRRMDQIFLTVESKRPFVLWHINPEREVAALYKLAKKHPKITFLIAHSMYSAQALQDWHAMEVKDGRRLNNVWIEISTYYQNAAGALFEDVTVGWRAFGMDRVLFGSDLAADFFSAEDAEAFLQIILTTDQLSDAEREMILDRNGRRFLSAIGVEP